MTPVDTPPWYEIVLPVASFHLDAATGALAGQGEMSTEVRERTTEASELVVYVQARDGDEASAHLARLSRSLGEMLAGEASLRRLEDRTWTENWKKHFPRLRIGTRLEVVPPWEKRTDEEADAGRDIVTVCINPAMAFGTGHHATTAGCLELIDRVVRPGHVVADVGCGTGVLAIAAVLLGARGALATDTDPDAVDAARANAELNGVSDKMEILRVEPDRPLGAASHAGFDLVVANIYAETLTGLRDHLTSCVNDEGHLVLSGIEASRWHLVEEAFVGTQWSVAHDVRDREWVTACLRRTRS